MCMCSTFTYCLYTHVRPRDEDARYKEKLEVDGDTLEETNTIYNDSKDIDDDEMEQG